MNHAEVLERLYGSREMAAIPDRWIGTAPVLVQYRGSRCDVFPFVNLGEKVELTGAILVSEPDGATLFLRPEEMRAEFGLKTTRYLPPPELNPDAYWNAENAYMTAYGALRDAQKPDPALWRAAAQRLRDVAGGSMTRDFYEVLAPELRPGTE